MGNVTWGLRTTKCYPSVVHSFREGILHVWLGGLVVHPLTGPYFACLWYLSLGAGLGWAGLGWAARRPYMRVHLFGEGLPCWGVRPRQRRPPPGWLHAATRCWHGTGRGCACLCSSLRANCHRVRYVALCAVEMGLGVGRPDCRGGPGVCLGGLYCSRPVPTAHFRTPRIVSGAVMCSCSNSLARMPDCGGDAVKSPAAGPCAM